MVVFIHSMMFVLMDQLHNFALCKEFLKKKKLKGLVRQLKKPFYIWHETESQNNHSNETSAVPTYLLTEIQGGEEIERE